MSSTLLWNQVAPRPADIGSAKYPLKGIVVKRYWDQYADGSLTYRDGVIIQAGTSDQSWLEGVVAGSEGELAEQANELLKSLIAHRQLVITVE